MNHNLTPVPKSGEAWRGGGTETEAWGHGERGFSVVSEGRPNPNPNWVP